MKHHKLKETLFLGALSLFCIGLWLFRFYYTGTTFFMFLNWNLVLAFVPWALTSLAVIKPDIQKKKIVVILLLLFWMLFFPNAPYILTDLFHLRSRSSIPVWFDLVLILSFAWTGLLFGFLSLWDIEKILGRYFNKSYVIFISVFLLFVTSFGIYLGRFLRWNSWDIIAAPSALIADIADRILNPSQHPATWGVTMFMWMFLNMLYWSFTVINNRNNSLNPDGASLKVFAHH